MDSKRKKGFNKFRFKSGTQRAKASASKFKLFTNSFAYLFKDEDTIEKSYVFRTSINVGYFKMFTKGAS